MTILKIETKTTSFVEIVLSRMTQGQAKTASSTVHATIDVNKNPPIS